MDQGNRVPDVSRKQQAIYERESLNACCRDRWTSRATFVQHRRDTRRMAPDLREESYRYVEHAIPLIVLIFVASNLDIRYSVELAAHSVPRRTLVSRKRKRELKRTTTWSRDICAETCFPPNDTLIREMRTDTDVATFVALPCQETSDTFSLFFKKFFFF